MEKAPLNYAAAARLGVATGTNSTNNANNTTQFNAVEASRFLHERWTSVIAELQDAKADDDKPKVYAQPSIGKVWGQSKLPLQPAVGNFLATLQDALNNNMQ